MKFTAYPCNSNDCPNARFTLYDADWPRGLRCGHCNLDIFPGSPKAPELLNRNGRPMVYGSLEVTPEMLAASQAPTTCWICRAPVGDSKLTLDGLPVCSERCTRRGGE